MTAHHRVVTQRLCAALPRQHILRPPCWLPPVCDAPWGRTGGTGAGTPPLLPGCGQSGAAVCQAVPAAGPSGPPQTQHTDQPQHLRPDTRSGGVMGLHCCCCCCCMCASHSAPLHLPISYPFCSPSCRPSSRPSRMPSLRLQQQCESERRQGCGCGGPDALQAHRLPSLAPSSMNVCSRECAESNRSSMLPAAGI